MRFDYPDLEVLVARARRERSEAVYQLIVAPLARLIAKLSARPLRLRRSRWIAVHHGS
jgi:hypothetical protein